VSKAVVDIPFRDPYLEWSFQSRFAGHAAGVDGDNLVVPVLVRLRDGGDLGQLDPSLIAVPGAYLGSKRGVCTGTAKLRDLAALESQVAMLEFSLPIRAGVVDTGTPEPSAKKAPALVIGVIDRDCAFLNSAFCRAMMGPERYKTRIAGIWDQSRSPVGRWGRPRGFGYGRELKSSAINTLLRRLKAGESEEAIYRDQATLLNSGGMVLERTHGTHVLDVASGLPSPNPIKASAKPIERDAAANASLVFVSVPGPTSDDTTGAAADVFVLDAIQYILAIAGDETVPVVINISVGALAGPHDGTSLIETAIDEILDKRRNLIVVVAAGNAAEEKWHAFGELPAANAKLGPSGPARFTWRVLPEDVTDSFVEIWFRSDSPSAYDGIKVRVTPPGGKPLGWKRLDEQLVLGTTRFPHAGMFLGRGRGVMGKDAMALLALAPTAGTRDRAPHGLWTVELLNTDTSSPVSFDAWVQRDEPAFGRGGTLQSFFESSAGCTIRGDASLNSLATGHNTVVVGASRMNDGSPANYSPRGADGKGRRPIRDIDVFASADESGSAYGLYAAAVQSGREVRMSGTSVSAPVAARHLANELVRPGGAFANVKGGVKAAQVREALRPSAADPAPRRGYDNAKRSKKPPPKLKP
jgi:hypothetical protein